MGERGAVIDAFAADPVMRDYLVAVAADLVDRDAGGRDVAAALAGRFVGYALIHARVAEARRLQRVGNPHHGRMASADERQAVDRQVRELADLPGLLWAMHARLILLSESPLMYAAVETLVCDAMDVFAVARRFSPPPVQRNA